MTDINKLEYFNQSIYTIKNYGIRPLSEQGIRGYFSKESLVHDYLPDNLGKNKLKLMEALIKKRNNNSKDINVINVKNENKNIENLKENVIEKNVKFVENEIKFNLTPENNEQDFKIENDIVPQLEHKNENLKNYEKFEKIFLNNKNEQNLKRTKSLNKINFKILSNTESKNSKNSKNKLVQNKSALNLRFKDDIINNLKEINTKLKDIISPSSNRSNNKINNSQISSSTGFKSFNVPRIKEDVSQQFRVNYTERIVKSVQGLRKNNINQEMNIEIEKENQKLKKILFNQTSQNFLIKANLPKISSMAYQPKIVIKDFTKENGKYLGERYNPYEKAETQKNWIARNYHGSLFQH